jgi:hypothetical protein
MGSGVQILLYQFSPASFYNFSEEISNENGKQYKFL